MPSLLLLHPLPSRNASLVSRFQVGELRKHQLLETRVRCYALRHERLTYNPCDNNANNISSVEASGFGARSTSVSSNIGLSGLGVSSSASGSTTTTSAAELAAKMPDQVFFQSHSMRLQHPDDELGGNLLLVLPQASTAVISRTLLTIMDTPRLKDATITDISRL